MIKEFLFKKALQAQARDIPKLEQEKMIKIVTENPEFFKKIAADIQAKMKEGKSQMSATMEVMKLHQNELKKLKS